jgi:hypothetical protein
MMMIKKSISITVMTMVTFILVLGGGGTHTILSTYAASNTRVAAGGNWLSWDSYSPQSVRINTGDSVTLV